VGRTTSGPQSFGAGGKPWSRERVRSPFDERAMTTYQASRTCGNGDSACRDEEFS
jgi:hypothetical protein